MAKINNFYYLEIGILTENTYKISFPKTGHFAHGGRTPQDIVTQNPAFQVGGLLGSPWEGPR